MDKLKDFIDTHRADFEDDLLPEGHLERFEKKLGKGRGALKVYLQALAGVAAIGLFIFLLVPNELKDKLWHREALTFACEAEVEMEELRLYYNMQMYGVVTEIDDLYAILQTPGSFGLKEEKEKVLQATYDFEENILPSLPCSDAGIFAMNQYYSNSLESLRFMLEQMKQNENIQYN
jgi:hypothetical protein